DPASLVRTGYVHTIYEEICRQYAEAPASVAGLTQLANPAGISGPAGIPGSAGVTGPTGTPGPASFFLCGWKNMIDEAKQRIQALGYDRKSIHQELYG
ncbi:MAG TPA: hypothetical protein VK518_25470, partial [Puia sp.]|nr:hypothetical protein [Puia sp.]